MIEGLFEVIQRLFRVTLREAQGRGGVAPGRALFRHPARGPPIGGFFLDVYARAHKRSGAWMDECVGRKTTASGTALPVAYLVCNALPPGGDRPAMLTHHDVVTLFHEFGHGLHHLLTRIGYPSVAGINGVAWDAVELPSQFMENYAWHPEVLARITQHVRTGAPLPADKQRQLIATRSFQAGLATLRQVEFALFDFRLHAEYEPGSADAIRALLAEVRREVAVVQIPRGTAIPQLLRTSSRAATRPATTATSGPRCSPRTRSRRSPKPGLSTPPRRSASSTASCRAAAAATRSRDSSSSAVGRRT